MVRESTSAALEAEIRRNIDRRTWRSIHQLHVEAREDRVLLRGFSTSYYTKQLAVAAVHEVLGGDRARVVDLQIEVGDSLPRCTEGKDASLCS
jgi:hypothetical protein